MPCIFLSPFWSSCSAGNVPADTDWQAPKTSLLLFLPHPALLAPRGPGTSLLSSAQGPPPPRLPRPHSPGLGAQGLDFALLDELAAPQLLNLPVQVADLRHGPQPPPPARVRAGAAAPSAPHRGLLGTARPGRESGGGGERGDPILERTRPPSPSLLAGSGPPESPH